MCRVSNVKIKTGYCLHYKTDYPDVIKLITQMATTKINRFL